VANYVRDPLECLWSSPTINKEVVPGVFVHVFVRRFSIMYINFFHNNSSHCCLLELQ
jgi:hypothetical protein